MSVRISIDASEGGWSVIVRDNDAGESLPLPNYIRRKWGHSSGQETRATAGVFAPRSTL